ncbi:hypothetical protein Ga0080559_TMP2659 [Salipiger profundus]|uniref:Uncharacterized protein n=1 Tax=Salipiger profundus TaxID=1229727 RepID=A0A1U7D5W3_9RHOB|nr:hypothetical protein Ga0080559_TMP2659 [Salipiger profundus]
MAKGRFGSFRPCSTPPLPTTAIILQRSALRHDLAQTAALCRPIRPGRLRR